MSKGLNIEALIGCEESQTVCLAFRKLGIQAYSCDLQECSGGHPEWHIQGDLFKVIAEHPEIKLGIMHPPCTFLTITGNRWFSLPSGVYEKTLTGHDRVKAMTEAVQFVKDIWNCPIPKIVIENPIGKLSSLWRKPDQIIHPYYFGDPFHKLTCLWLKNTPPLYHNQEPNLFDEMVTHTEPEERYYWNDSKTGKKKSQPRWYAMAKQSGGNRGKIRSKSFPGISQAMAEQWAPLINQ